MAVRVGVDRWIEADEETSQDIAETRKLVELAAQRCVELKAAVERAKGDGPDGAQAMVARAMAETPQILRPISGSMMMPTGVQPSVSRFSSVPSNTGAPQLPTQISYAPQLWSGVGNPPRQVVSYPVSAYAPGYPGSLSGPQRMQVLAGCRSSPAAFRTIQVSRPGSMMVSHAVTDQSTMSGSNLVDDSKVANGGSMASVVSKRQRPTLPSISLLLAGKKCASGSGHLYEAPFSPSLCYKDGEELLRVPAGWAALRTKGGLLLWLELREEKALSEAIKSLASTQNSGAVSPPSPAGRKPRQSSPQRSISSLKEGEVKARRATTASGRLMPFALTLQLPSGPAASNVTRQAPVAPAPLTIIARARGSCIIESAVKLALEDVMVLHASGGGSVGIRASLSLAEGAGQKGGVDGALKAWLSSLGPKGSYEC